MKRPLVFEADWELRCGPQNRFRIFYEVDQKQQAVYIWAIGIKKGNRVYVGRKEIEL